MNSTGATMDSPRPMVLCNSESAQNSYLSGITIAVWPHVKVVEVRYILAPSVADFGLCVRRVCRLCSGIIPGQCKSSNRCARTAADQRIAVAGNV